LVESTDRAATTDEGLDITSCSRIKDTGNFVIDTTEGVELESTICPISGQSCELVVQTFVAITELIIESQGTRHEAVDVIQVVIVA